MSQFYTGIVAGNFNNVVPVTIPSIYPYFINAMDYAIIVDTSEERTIELPSNPVIGVNYLIKDDTGLSGTNPITIDGNGNNIDGTPLYTIQLNFGANEFLFNGTQWNVI